MTLEKRECHYRCDQCGRGLRVNNHFETTLPPVTKPWREVALVGWAGKFHCCSDQCEDELRERYVRGIE